MSKGQESLVQQRLPNCKASLAWVSSEGLVQPLPFLGSVWVARKAVVIDSTWQPLSSGPKNTLCMPWTVSECWHHWLSGGEDAYAYIPLYGSEMHSCPRGDNPCHSSFSFICGEACADHQSLLPAWAAPRGSREEGRQSLWNHMPHFLVLLL